MAPKVTHAGDRGLLADFGPDVIPAELHARAAALRGREDVAACIVGHQSLYVIFTGEPRLSFDDVSPLAVKSRTHVIDVDFSGPDLDELLGHAGLTHDVFLSRIPFLRLVARYLGFRAGFAYLDGWPSEWQLPRRATSRNVVPRGSFAIAGTMAGFYPVDSPGGWNILGRTNEILWDPNAEPPNRFAPGDVIELRATAMDRFDSMPAIGATNDAPVIADVISAGQLTTIVGAHDWKRVEYGVTPGGPFDGHAAARANRAVGNDDAASLLECVLVGPRLRFRVAKRAAFCDGSGNVQTFASKAGEELDVGRLHGGLRGYLAIEGGIDEMRAAFAEGPYVLRKNDQLCTAGAPSAAADIVMEPGVVDRESEAGESNQVPRVVRERNLSDTRLPTPDTRRHDIRIILGPHDAPPLPEEWEVTAELNRIGIRFRRTSEISVLGEALPRMLPSCGMQFGTLQWHPDGSLVAMGPDHPVTGGYLQPATVISDDLWKLAQLAPGERVRLVAV